MDEEVKAEAMRLEEVIGKALEKATKGGVDADALFYAVLYNLIRVVKLAEIPREDLLAAIANGYDRVEAYLHD